MSGPDIFVVKTEFVLGVRPQHLAKDRITQSPIDLRQ